MSNLKRRLLDKILPFEVRKGGMQDFEQTFSDISAKKGKFAANIWFLIQVIQMLPSVFIAEAKWSLYILKNNIKISFRNIKKYKVYSFINIFGFSIGITCSILIMIYVQNEFSYDKFHENADNIYRVVQRDKSDNRFFNSVPAILGPTLRENFPEIKGISRIRTYERIVRSDNIRSIEKRIFFVEPDFFKIFSFPIVKGDPFTALDEPNTIMLTMEMANKYFGNENPIGKIISISHYSYAERPPRFMSSDYRITGILENTPYNSHFKFDFLASFQSVCNTWSENQLYSWKNSSVYTYVLLSNHSDPEKFEKKLLNYNTVGFNGTSRSFHLQPLTDIRLFSSHIDLEIEENNNIVYIYLFLSLAFLVLLIACFNYINLSSARSSTYSKEVGMRKVLGANKKQLILRFIGESVLFSLIALVLSVFFVKMSLPFFNTLFYGELEFQICHACWWSYWSNR